MGKVHIKAKRLAIQLLLKCMFALSLASQTLSVLQHQSQMGAVEWKESGLRD